MTSGVWERYENDLVTKSILFAKKQTFSSEETSILIQEQFYFKLRPYGIESSKIILAQESRCLAKIWAHDAGRWKLNNAIFYNKTAILKKYYYGRAMDIRIKKEVAICAMCM